MLCAISIVVFFLLYTSAGLVASGKLFNSVFALPYEFAVVLGAVIISLYTVSGGFLAVTWTDTLQAVMMLVMLVVVGSAIWLLGERPISSMPSAAVGVGTLSLTSALAWGLGYAGQPRMALT
jgi:sodium/proline symporter